MKTRISQLTVALFFAISLIAGNVNATEDDVKASSHENIEATLELENWMMDEIIWNTSTSNYAEATETNLELEDWMTKQVVWDVQFEGLTLEDWMMNSQIWEVESIVEVETETEQDLATENWMVNENIWKI